MSVKDMHYDFKTKLNKLDSNLYRNLQIPEIDRKLNEAMFIFIKSIAEPRASLFSGIEMNQRTIEDLRTILIDSLSIPATTVDNKHYFAELPEDYLYPTNLNILTSKDNCTNIVCEGIIRKHGDNHEESPFDVSSFEWREVNVHFVGNTVKMFTDNTFTINTLILDYLRKPKYIHNAEDFSASGYTLPNGTDFTGYQNCELPNHVHSEIVDLAVLIASGELNAADYQLKQMKIQLNQ